MEKRKIKAPLKQEKKPSLKRKILVTVILLGVAFSGAFLIYFIMQAVLNTSTPMVVVVSGSMEPNLLKGDLLFLRGTDPELIRNGTIEGKEGDIIVFDAYGLWDSAPLDPIVHRVIDKKYDNGWLFLTKGDANSHPDYSWIPENRIFGVVVGRIPFIGWVKIALTDSNLLIPLLVIVSILLVVSIIWDIFKKDDQEKEGKDEKKIYDGKETKDEMVIDYSKPEKL